VCEQLAQGCYLPRAQPEVELLNDLSIGKPTPYPRHHQATEVKGEGEEEKGREEKGAFPDFSF